MVAIQINDIEQKAKQWNKTKKVVKIYNKYTKQCCLLSKGLSCMVVPQISHLLGRKFKSCL